MRSIFQLCFMVLMLLGAGNRVWGKVAVGQNIAVRGFAEGGAFGNGVDEPPALMSSGEAAAWGYDCTVDVRDGPNVYAYVKQNPWTMFDPDGLRAIVFAHSPAEYERLKKQEGTRFYHAAEIRKGYKLHKDGSFTRWNISGTIFSHDHNGRHLYDIGLAYRDVTWVFDNAEHARIIQHHHEMLGLYSAMTGFSGLGRGMISKLPAVPLTALRPSVSKPPGDVSPVSTAIDEAVQAEQHVTKNVPVPAHPEGSFSITDWSGYPSHPSVPKPAGPFRLLEGSEKEAARKAANTANRATHRADPSLAGKDIHEIQPVKFGGSPTDPANKVPLTRSEHSPFTTWWAQFQRDLESR